MDGSPGIEALLLTPEPAELGPGPRAGVKPEGELTSAVAELLRGTKLPRENQQLIRALVLLWHDHLDTAHQLAQEIENADGSFVHGIMHRREPDYGNAAYWFRRVGRQGAFPAIAQRAAEALKAAKESALLGELIRDGEWDPFGFIAACERLAGRRPGDPQQRCLKEIQRVETVELLGWLQTDSK